MNSINIMGRLTADPVLRDAGVSTVVSFDIAYNKVWYKDGQKKEQVSFFNCEAWGKTGSTIHEHMRKGNRILLTGSLQQDRWEQEGSKRSKVKIVVSLFYFVDGKGEISNTKDDDVPF